MRRIMAILLTLVSAQIAFAGGKKDSAPANPDYIASTSWTAAFADIAGIDGVAAVAPASLRHPPEYEVTVSDIQRINGRRFFIYAGFERMMETLGSSVGTAQLVQIPCDNSIQTVRKNAEKLSELAGTQAKAKERVERYVSEIEGAAEKLADLGLKGAHVLCNANQVYLARELGLDVAATFGPGPVTAEQIADAQKGGYALIIDNVHNPVGQPLAEVSPGSAYIIWRNFPDTVEHDALLHVVQSNIKAILDGRL